MNPRNSFRFAIQIYLSFYPLGELKQFLNKPTTIKLQPTIQR